MPSLILIGLGTATVALVLGINIPFILFIVTLLMFWLLQGVILKRYRV